MTGWQSRALDVPENHATADMHFPGRPVIPGALLLDEVVLTLDLPGPISIRAVKFLAPAPHGTPLELRWQTEENGLRRFEIRRRDTAVSIVTGILEPTL